MSDDVEVLRRKIKKIEDSNVGIDTRVTSIDQNDVAGSIGFDASRGETKDSETAKKIRWSAMELLSRREHSRKELGTKLSKRYPDEAQEIEHSIEGLARRNLQSDDRFCEAYTAMRRKKGYGPQRIAAELRERGLKDSVIKRELSAEVHDWFAVAMDVWQRKFRGVYPEDLKEKARQVRFLNYRGFYQDHIDEVFYR